MKFSSSQISALIKDIYTGKTNVLNLPKNLYLAIANFLNKGVSEGFKTAIAYDVADLAMLKELKTNVFLFSGAKTFNYVAATEGLIMEGEKIIPFKEFKVKAKEVFDLHNDKWLKAEYDTAIGQAQSARAWGQFEKEAKILPYLKYITTHDARVSEVCKQLDGIVKPVKDPFWNMYSPLNHYSCRCLLQSYEEATESTLIGKDLIKPDSVFATNPGKTGEIFNKNHPYFTEVPVKFRKIAKENFGLPLPNDKKGK